MLIDTDASHETLLQVIGLTNHVQSPRSQRVATEMISQKASVMMPVTLLQAEVMPCETYHALF